VEVDLNTKTIYIRLLDEGTEVARPTQGVPLKNNLYRVLSTPDYNPEDEKWEFPPESIVRCRLEEWTDGKIFMAYELVESA
jgi:hypothetical protein